VNDHVKILRALIASERGIILPGVPNALSARIVADLGFKAVYLTGAGLTNMFLGLPDLGFMDLSQIVEHTMAIRNVIEVPLIVDADTGFGNALHVSHTVRMLERAGASAIQLEDQRMPKRCGHFSGKDIVPVAEMVGKIKAAVDARSNDIVIIARTDARAVDGFEAAIDRASQYIEAGADLTFVEAPETLDEIGLIPKLLMAPQVLNIVLGGKTPTVERSLAIEMGFSLLLYANAALQAAVGGMQAVLRTLAEKGALDESQGILATFAERQRLVGKAAFDAMESRYVTDDFETRENSLKMPGGETGRESQGADKKGYK
jgi:2-methylisocitrate lyase-like PEP mutase family enzyme